MGNDQRTQETKNILQRRVQGIFPSENDVVARLSGSESLTFYLGIDPTGPIHLGHSIPLLLLADLQRLGHRAIVLIGDFTARLGDPTGKSASRVALTHEQVEQNMASYVSVIQKILTPDSFRYNTEWYSSMNFEEVIRLTGRVTVQQMLVRDMFQERMKHDKPIYVNEFLYPIMQGYDSVALRVDGEVGGNDQTFNMLVGREFEKDILGKDKIVLATYLLADPVTGKKMSKTEGSFVALEDSPQEMRRKILALDDALIATIFQLCTRRDVAAVQQQCDSPRLLKEELAAELVRMYHGEQAVAEATQPARVDFSGPLDRALVVAGISASATAAHNLLNEGAVRVNNEVVKEWKHELARGDIVAVGKGKSFTVE